MQIFYILKSPPVIFQFKKQKEKKKGKKFTFHFFSI